MVSLMMLDLRASGRPEAATEEVNEPVAGQGIDYSKFGHESYSHSRLPCLLCHQRKDNSTRPAFSGHMPCSGCHIQQFKDPQSGICTVCHVNAQSAALLPFPGLKSFTMRFDHARHTGGGRTSLGCVTCHSSARNGVAMSIPSGARGHQTCFGCHSVQAKNAAGESIGSCNTCHQMGRLVRTSENAPAFRVSFRHDRHSSQKGLNCADCHTVRPGTVPARQVTAPSPLMHHATGQAQSCMSCHNGKRAFGGDDFTSCKRCHTTTHFYF